MVPRKEPKEIAISFRGLIQTLHFASKVRAPTPSELRRHDVWPNWMHKQSKQVRYAPNNVNFVRVSAIYCIEALRIKYGVIVPYTWDILENNLDSLLHLIYDKLGLRPFNRRQRIAQESAPEREACRYRSQVRMTEYNRKKGRAHGSLQRTDAVRTKGRYIPPHRRPLDVCPVCGVKYRTLKRLMFQSYQDTKLHAYWRRQKQILTEQRGYQNAHEKRVAEREAEANRVCHCNMPDGGADFHGRFLYAEQNVKHTDDDDYFASLAMGLGL